MSDIYLGIAKYPVALCEHWQWLGREETPKIGSLLPISLDPITSRFTP